MEDRVLLSRNIHAPKNCEKCDSSSIKYKGVGEYECEDCGHIMYDDFGLVHNYLEEHRGATQQQVSQATGVSMETIRQFLRDDRIEIIEGSGTFMYCEICGSPIRSGRFCENCRAQMDKVQKEQKASNHQSSMQGFGMGTRGESGARRFKR